MSHEFAGLRVTLLKGLFDKELRISHNDEHYGPFYPADRVIPFGSYKSFKKTSQERRADQIEKLAKTISIPRTVLSNGGTETQELITAANLIEEKAITRNIFEIITRRLST